MKGARQSTLMTAHRQFPFHSLLEQSKNGGLFRSKSRKGAAQLAFGPALQGLNEGTIQIGFKNRGMDVALATYRLRVAQSFCHGLDGPRSVALCPRLRIECLELLECLRRQNCACPSSKVLGSDVLTGNGA